MFHDVQRKPMLQFHARGAEYRAHRSRRPTLLPDHFANVALRNAQSNDSGFAVCNRLNRHAAWIINQSACYLGYKVCHIFYRVFPCRKLRRLNHHTHLRNREFSKKRSSLSHSLVYCEIFQVELQRAKHRSQIVRLLRRPSALQSQPNNYAIPRSLR